MVGRVRVGLLLVHADPMAIAEVVVIAAVGVHEHEVIRGSRGGQLLEVDGRLDLVFGDAELVEQAQLLGEKEVSVGGIVVLEGEIRRAKASAEERGREHRVVIALGEHRARACEIGKMRVEADEIVTEALELDRGDLLIVIAREEAQIGAAEFHGSELGGHEVVDIAEEARLRRSRRRTRAEDGGQLGLGDAAGLFALRDARVEQRGRRAANGEKKHGGRRRPPGARQAE